MEITQFLSDRVGKTTEFSNPKASAFYFITHAIKLIFKSLMLTGLEPSMKNILCINRYFQHICFYSDLCPFLLCGQNVLTDA